MTEARRRQVISISKGKPDPYISNCVEPDIFNCIEYSIASTMCKALLTGMAFVKEARKKKEAKKNE